MICGCVGLLSLSSSATFCSSVRPAWDPRAARPGRTPKAGFA
jgi:hypothetical protein